jgi:hypothetical protein
LRPLQRICVDEGNRRRFDGARQHLTAAEAGAESLYNSVCWMIKRGDRERAIGNDGSPQSRPRMKCCFGNTRLKTASRRVQTASLSLPVGACELVWACDGGGHSQGRPFWSFRCLGDKEGIGRSGW